ncbi:hypothetical protein [Microcystis phage LMM01]|uniref:Uncharacterized protein n=1 Tax=Microcystis phage LMM01 TaxID=2856824 RepID=A0A7R3_9CAUD|nr:hypothetical protein MaLMM01_gp149 [Microcystis phage LMM01]BAF36240.1 hypothetical protein [Microcystis phage LMM01]
MKIINSNGWAPRTLDEWNAPVPITVPLIADNNKLFYNFYLYNGEGPAWFYRLLYFDEYDSVGLHVIN